jgi:hypothetical protein
MRMHAEVAMKHVLEVKPIELPARSAHRIEGGKGLQITCIGGVAWITQASDPRDIVLSRGQSFILDRKGLAVVYALKDATIVVSPAGHITTAKLDATLVQDFAA